MQHGELRAELFFKWVSEKLLINLVQGWGQSTDKPEDLLASALTSLFSEVDLD